MRSSGKQRLVTLKMSLRGASKADVARGVDAALRQLAAAGVAPQQAAEAAWVSYAHVLDGRAVPEPYYRAAQAWEAAEQAAIDACCSGWPSRPMCASLALS